MTNQALYDLDFYAWANEQASLLRAGRLSEADIEHIAEEIESMGRSEKRELVSRLNILLLHLLKWRYQSTHRGVSWRISIDNARGDIADHLGDNPSLTSQLDASIVAAYRRARGQAAIETGLAQSLFPPVCPWTAEQIMEPEFLPEST